jgi:hypothetical protein
MQTIPQQRGAVRTSGAPEQRTDVQHERLRPGDRLSDSQPHHLADNCVSHRLAHDCVSQHLAHDCVSQHLADYGFSHSLAHYGVPDQRRAHRHTAATSATLAAAAFAAAAAAATLGAAFALRFDKYVRTRTPYCSPSSQTHTWRVQFR